MPVKKMIHQQKTVELEKQKKSSFKKIIEEQKTFVLDKQKGDASLATFMENIKNLKKSC